MRILITGGNGFIARSLFERLVSKYTITSYNSKELNLLDSDKVFQCLKSGKFDVVIHTATYDCAPSFSTKDPTKVLENNLRMFFNIARCKDYFGKMIYFGSGAEFSRENWIPKMEEDYFGKNIPQDQYGFSKYIMNRYTELKSNIYNLRLFGVFGKYDDWRYRFIPNACARAVMDLPITINQNVYFDYMYIDDLISIADWFIINKPSNNTYNICTGKTYDLKTLAEKVLRISKKDLKITIKKEGLGREYSGNNSKLLREISKFKFTPMDEAIKEMLDYHAENKQVILQSGWEF